MPTGIPATFEDCLNNISRQENGYLWNLRLIINQSEKNLRAIFYKDIIHFF